ncbi:MAG: hypothetical protein RI964_2772 [Pseudomonadota bacterium]|jgi:hypothetical protein
MLSLVKNSLVMIGLSVAVLSGCDGHHLSAQALAAQAMSQRVATANAQAYLARSYKNQYSGLACKADDDIDNENLAGDGDADCQFVVTATKKKQKLECSTFPGQGCKKEH